MTTLTALFITMSAQYGLPAGLLESLCYVESKHTIMALHKDDGDANSVGICQIKLATAKEMGFKGTEKDLYDPKSNIKYAAKFLAKQIKRYKSTKRGVIAYNKGNARGLTESKYQRKVYKQWQTIKEITK